MLTPAIEWRALFRGHEICLCPRVVEECSPQAFSPFNFGHVRGVHYRLMLDHLIRRARFLTEGFEVQLR